MSVRDKLLQFISGLPKRNRMFIDGAENSETEWCMEDIDKKAREVYGSITEETREKVFNEGVRRLEANPSLRFFTLALWDIKKSGLRRRIGK